jgi:hypothetical protein
MKNIFATLSISILFSLNVLAQTQLGNSIAGLNINPNEQFGSGLCMSDDGYTVAANICFSNQVGGITRVYEYSNGNWAQKGTSMLGNTGDTIVSWENNMAMDGNGSRIAIAYPEGRNPNGNKKGYVVVYEFKNNSWQQLGQILFDSNAGNYYGSAIDMSDDGNRIIIGSKGYGSAGRGQAQIFDFDNINWNQVGQTIVGNTAGDFLGSSIAISDDKKIIAIGASGSFNGSTTFGFGKVTVLELVANQWTQIGNTFQGGEQQDFLGIDLSLSENGKVIAISERQDGSANNNVGEVNIYQYENNNWSVKGNSLIGDQANGLFGTDIDLDESGNRIVIGAFAANIDSGEAKVYDYLNGNWTQTGSRITGAYSSAQTGGAVAISANGSTFGVSSWRSNLNGNFSGAVRVYSLNPTSTSRVSYGGTKIEIYPNPSKSKFTISIDSKTQDDLSLKIMDINGRTINTIEKKCSPGSNEFKMNNQLATGTYLLKVTGSHINTSQLFSVK